MNQQVATRTNVEQVCMSISRDEFKGKIKAALPPGIDPDRFQRVVLTAVQQNPKLADADRQSLYNAALRAAADGLVPDGREGAFVEYSVKQGNGWAKAVQWMPMVGGVIKRLATAGITIDAQLVYANDEFEQIMGDDPAIHHKAPKLGMPRGDIIGAYAIARLPNGMIMREVMDREMIEQVRSASKSKDSGPWVAWFGEMARKTVLRRLAKRLPILDPKVADTIQRDDELYDFAAGNAGEGDTPPPPTEARQGPRRPRGLDSVAAAGNAAAASAGDVLDGEYTDVTDGDLVAPAGEQADDAPPADGQTPDF